MVAIPSYLDQATWTAFCEMRQAMGKSKPFTVYAAKLIIYELQKLKDAGHDPTQALNQSILNGWADVYEPRQKQISRAQRQQASETAAFLARQDEISSSPDVRAEVVRALKVVRHR